MELDKLFGLPAHPLLVHIPVVLLPISAILAIVIVFHGGLRERLRWIVLGLGVVSTLFTLMAAGSGEALEERLNEHDNQLLEAHTSNGDTMKLVAVLFLVSLLVYVVVERKLGAGARADAAATTEKESPRNAGSLALGIVLSLVSLFTIGWITKTGHSGAKSVWQEDVGSEGDDVDEEEEGLVAPGGARYSVGFGPLAAIPVSG